jgi:hypothetical protein
LYAARFVFRKRRRSTIWCLASSSTATSSGDAADRKSTTLKHLCVAEGPGPVRGRCPRHAVAY